MPICNNMNNQALVDSWRDAEKKVILSFGGEGMGGSWSGMLLFVLVYGKGVYPQLSIFGLIKIKALRTIMLVAQL